LIKFCSYYFDENNLNFCTISNYEGSKLSDIIEENSKINNRMEYGEVIMFFAQLVLAVEYLHVRNIFHSFINISEIYITDAKTLKLGGFYFCEKLSSYNDIGKIDRILYYDCPEYPNIGFRYDIWCMGCVFYDTSQSSLTNGKISQYSDLSKTFTNDDDDNVYHMSTVNNNSNLTDVMAMDSDSNTETIISSSNIVTRSKRVIKLAKEFRTFKSFFRSLTNADPTRRPKISDIFESSELMNHELKVAVEQM
jgi:serine/threonine protein kinase